MIILPYVVIRIELYDCVMGQAAALYAPGLPSTWCMWYCPIRGPGTCEAPYVTVIMAITKSQSLNFQSIKKTRRGKVEQCVNCGSKRATFGSGFQDPTQIFIFLRNKSAVLWSYHIYCLNKFPLNNQFSSLFHMIWDWEVDKKGASESTGFSDSQGSLH